MLKEIARYGKFKAREEPIPANDGVVNTVDKSVSKPKKVKKTTDRFDPFAIYDYDIDYTEEVNEDGSDILEQDS